MRSVIAIGFLLLLTTSYADSLRLPLNEIESLGYRKAVTKAPFSRLQFQGFPYAKHSLDWPISFLRPENQFIGNMHQFQTFTNPSYYHGGVDVLAKVDQEVFAPVAGVIEAGYYAYTDQHSGESEKYFLPLKEALENDITPPSGKRYFEVAIIDSFGNRFEFHHVNPDNLPPVIFDKIMAGNQQVDAGTLVGHIIDFKSVRKKEDMSHLHYNVIHSLGHYYNPFQLSKKIKDTTPPKIINILRPKQTICYKVPELTPFREEALPFSDEIIINAVDFVGNGIFEQAPMIIKAEFNNGEIFEWDFTETLLSPLTGKRHHLHELYLNDQCFTKRGSQRRASSSFNFFFRIPIPKNYSGEVKVTVYDQNLNAAERTISIK